MPKTDELGVDAGDVRIHDAQWRAMNKYRMQNSDTPKAFLPFGVTIDGSAYMGVRPPGSDRTAVMHTPEKYLKESKPGHKYMWRLRNDEATFGFVESHQIRPVPMSNLHRVTETAQCFAYQGPGEDGQATGYVALGRMGLFEVTPQASYEWFQQPADWSMRLTMGRSEDFTEQVEQFTQGKMTGHIERKDVRKGG